jgi:hypothetical protein
MDYICGLKNDMARILINDGIHPTGEKLLKEAGHEVVTTTIN